MIKRLVLLAAMTLAFVMTVSADLWPPSCLPDCQDFVSAR
jgi:hypothetical protein